MNPITIIRERIEQSKRREEGVQAAPWEVKDGDIVSGDRFIVGIRQYNHVAGVRDWPITVANKAFIASARSDLPMWRSIAERAVEALEKHRAWDNEIMDACGEAESVLTAIAQQLAVGGTDEP